MKRGELFTERHAPVTRDYKYYKYYKGNPGAPTPSTFSGGVWDHFSALLGPFQRSFGTISAQKWDHFSANNF